MPRIDHRVHDLPIRGIPADQEEAFSAHVRRKKLTAESAEDTEEEPMSSTQEQEREDICDRLLGRL